MTSADYAVCMEALRWLKQQDLTPREAVAVFGVALTGGERHELLHQPIVGWDDVFDVIALEWRLCREILGASRR